MMQNKFSKRMIRFSVILFLTGFFMIPEAKATINSADEMDHQPFFFENHLTEDPPYKERDYKLQDRNGKHSNMADLKDKVVFINFWATWCPPCIAEMPNINKLYQDYKDDEDVVFLMITLDDDFDKAKDFVDKRSLDFNIYRPRSRMPKEFQSRGIPVTFVLDKQGEIAYKHEGMGNYNTVKFKDFLEELKAK